MTCSYVLIHTIYLYMYLHMYVGTYLHNLKILNSVTFKDPYFDCFMYTLASLVTDDECNILDLRT